MALVVAYVATAYAVKALYSYGADVFFDDQQMHCTSASEYVATGHVPHGVANELPKKD